MKKEIAESITDHEYQSLIEDCKDILTEHVFQSRWVLLEGYHLVGERIAKEEKRLAPKFGDNFMDKMAQEINIKPRDLYNAVKFYKKWPDIQKIPDGKNASWSKIRNEYLIEKPREVEKTKICICERCGDEHIPSNK